VAPTTATFIVFYGFQLLKIKKPSLMEEGLLSWIYKISDSFPGQVLLGILLCICCNHAHRGVKITYHLF
jgi:hypothetical protein